MLPSDIEYHVLVRKERPRGAVLVREKQRERHRSVGSELDPLISLSEVDGKKAARAGGVD